MGDKLKRTERQKWGWGHERRGEEKQKEMTRNKGMDKDGSKKRRNKQEGSSEERRSKTIAMEDKFKVHWGDRTTLRCPLFLYPVSGFLCCSAEAAWNKLHRTEELAGILF